MNKIFMALMALSILSTTQAAPLHDEHLIERHEHCMDALGKDYANLDDERRNHHCDNAAGVKTWGQLKGEMEEQRHKDEIERYMSSHG